MKHAELLRKMAHVEGQMPHEVGESGGWITGATEIYRERQGALIAGADALDEVAVLQARVGALAGALAALLRTMGISA